MKAAITGGTGFVGRALTERLLADGHSVRILSRSAHAPDARPGVEYAQADYGDAASLASALDGCDTVVHLAAVLFANDESTFTRANVDATARLAQACNENPAVKNLIYLSSLAAGGPSADPAKPRTEEDAEAPVSAYGRSKLGGERALEQLRSDIRKTVLRAPIIYGPHDSGAYLIAKWVKSGLMLNPGGGTAHFSFIFIDDLSAALHRAVCDASLPGLYYVSENRSYQWRQYVLELAKAMRCKPPLMISVPALPLAIAGFLSEKGAALLGKTALFNRDKARESLAGHWICSPAKWEKAAGFASWTPLERGLAATFGANH